MNTRLMDAIRCVFRASRHGLVKGGVHCVTGYQETRNFSPDADGLSGDVESEVTHLAVPNDVILALQP